MRRRLPFERAELKVDRAQGTKHPSLRAPRVESQRWIFDAATPERRSVLNLARRVAPSNCTVLILGPTGVGKEVLAEDIHNHSARASGPFIALNCAALTPSLVENELFGHVRGAFTGAHGDKAGLVELANGGTLFLDEVGELPSEAQAKMLRFIAKGTYWPLGSTRERYADVRILSATHRQVDEMGGGIIREDFFYRLSVVIARIPPLASDDIHAIACSLLFEMVSRGRAFFSEADIELIAKHCSERVWPGGVREIKNALERLQVLWEAERASEEQCAQVLGGRPPASRSIAGAPRANYGTLMKDLNNIVFLSLAAECADVRDLAERTGKTVQAVYGRLKKLGVAPQAIGSRAALEEPLKRLRSQLSPHADWVQSLLSS